MKVYLAGPIRFADDDGRGWREDVVEQYDDIEWLNPQPLEDEYTGAKIREIDREMIDEADALLLKYEQIPMYGTPREHEYAVANDTPVYAFTYEDEWSLWLDDAEIVASSIDTAIKTLTRNNT